MDEDFAKTSYATAWAADVSPAEWRRRILTLHGPLRGAVAAVVWWDFFGMRPWAERWPHLDDLIGRADSVTNPKLYEGLIAVGYPAKRAAWRMRQGRTRKEAYKYKP